MTRWIVLSGGVMLATFAAMFGVMLAADRVGVVLLDIDLAFGLHAAFAAAAAGTFFVQGLLVALIGHAIGDPS